MFQFLGNIEHALDKLKASKETVTGVVGTSSGWVTGVPATPRRRMTYAQSQVIYSQPMFYSPLHTPQNWQIPQRRRDVYQWLRFWSENEPKVAAAIDFYAGFPVNGFETQCANAKVKRYFDNLNKKLNLDYWVKMISREFYLIGDVFPFLEIQCDLCYGTGILPDGSPCAHKGGTIRRVVILNPDSIEVQKSSLVEESVITLVPDEELRRVVWNKKPLDIYNRIPPHIRTLILSNRPVPLSNECVSHLKYNPYPYGVYGTSIIRRLFKTLAYKDKLMIAQWTVAERLILPIRVVKVGSPDRPASAADIADIQAQLAQVANDPNLTLVTHDAFEYDWYGASGKVLALGNEFDLINQEILQGLMINEALLSGQMAGYQSAAIGVEAMIQRMEGWRLDLARWIEDWIYRPVAKMQGFIDKEASEEFGEEIYVIPKIKWNDLNLRDDTQQKQLWLQLLDKGIISMQTLCEKFDLDYDHEIERKRFESAQQMMVNPAPGGGGMPPGGGGAPMPPAGGMEGGGMEGMVPEAVPSGGAPMPGMEAAPMGAPPTAPMAGSEGKILTRGKKSLKAPQESDVEPASIPLTSLEQEMYKMIQSLEIPFQKWIQYPIGSYKADFAIPMIRLDIECDGQKWHATPDAKAHDKKRDGELANSGWTIIRFGELEIKENQEAIKKTIIGYVYKLWQQALEQQKKQQAENKHRTASLERLFETHGEKTEATANEVENDGEADQGQGNNLEGELRGEVGVAQE